MRVRVLIRPKAGILDAQGQAVERALPALGFEGVANVHVGRLVELDVDAPGRSQPSFDKQYVRDWASATGWDKSPPAPAIPPDVVAQTRERYVRAYEQLAGEPFSAWLERVGAA